MRTSNPCLGRDLWIEGARCEQTSWSTSVRAEIGIRFPAISCVGAGTVRDHDWTIGASSNADAARDSASLQVMSHLRGHAVQRERQ